MTPQRLRFALEELEPTQWARFEQFASSFLAAEYPELRTVAGSGDRGRDAELYEPSDDPAVKVQYSVAEGWPAKIVATAKDIKENFPDSTELVYATNQKIGHLSDPVKTRLRREFNLFLDVRDREWFVERYSFDAGRQAAAESLVEDIAIPILSDRSLVERKAPALTSTESRAACLHLALQYRDDTRDKGLTKLCFEALVRATLRDTTPKARMSRSVIHDRIAGLLKATARERIVVLTDGALTRLEGRAIRRWSQEDEFCLAHDERARVQESLVGVELAEIELLEAIDWEVGRSFEAYNKTIPANVREYSQCVRVAVETTLLRQGEAFAAAVAANEAIQAPTPDVEAAANEAMVQCGIDAKAHAGIAANIVRSAARVVMTEPSEAVQEFLRAFADAYTLFAFLRETPDVQSAVVKMFSAGEIWLDTTVILPLLAETLIDDKNRRRFTNMFQSAVDCGLELRITEGVLEEIESHTWNAIRYSREPNDWPWRVPFLAATFLFSGYPSGRFAGWVEKFRGRKTPLADLAEYLWDEHKIRTGSLEKQADSASTEIRGVVQEVWRKAHERRRGGQLDPNTQARLVRHDLENYLGVVQKRVGEERDHLGSKTWWLTLDSTAYDVREELYKHFGRHAPDSPVMSPDFMVSYLTIGPLRRQLSKSREAKLPLSVADLGPTEDLPRELIAEAEELRAEMYGKDDRVITRTLRERYDIQRRRIGSRARGGLRLVQGELEGDLQSET